MPRRKPVVPVQTPRKSKNEFKIERDYTYSLSVPCFKCAGFMFLVTSTYDRGDPVDELECFVCKKIKRIGPHDPKRFSVESNRKSKPRRSYSPRY